MNNSDTFNPINHQSGFQSEGGAHAVQPSRRKFDNQYNNAKYLVHPERTYTQKILNMIFEPKENKSLASHRNVKQQGDGPTQHTMTFQGKESVKKAESPAKVDPKTKKSAPTQQGRSSAAKGTR